MVQVYSLSLYIDLWHMGMHISPMFSDGYSLLQQIKALERKIRLVPEVSLICDDVYETSSTLP